MPRHVSNYSSYTSFSSLTVHNLCCDGRVIELEKSETLHELDLCDRRAVGTEVVLDILLCG